MSYTILLIQLENFTKFHAAVAELQVDLALCKTNALVFVHVRVRMRVRVRCSRRLTHVLCCALSPALSAVRDTRTRCVLTFDSAAAVVCFHSQLCSLPALRSALSLTLWLRRLFESQQQQIVWHSFGRQRSEWTCETHARCACKNTLKPTTTTISILVSVTTTTRAPRESRASCFVSRIACSFLHIIVCVHASSRVEYCNNKRHS